MSLRNIDRNEIVKYQKRIDRHKRDIENKEKIAEKTKTKEITKDNTTKKIAKDNTTKKIAKDNTTKKIAKDNTTKKIVAGKKRLSKELMGEIKRKAEEKAYKGISEEEEEHHEEPIRKISKEERTKRFKKLHEMAIRMTKQWKKNNR